jgi:hypothetical protein
MSDHDNVRRSYSRIKRYLAQFDDCPGLIKETISPCMFDVPIYHFVCCHLRVIGWMDFLDMADIIAEEQQANK